MEHFHTGIDAAVWSLLVVALGFHVMRMIAAWLVTRGGPVGAFGTALGGVFTFAAPVNS